MLAAGCSKSAATASAEPDTTESRRVFVIQNSASPASVEIVTHYVKARKISRNNVVSIFVDPNEEISRSEFYDKIVSPVKERLNKATFNVDFIVTTKGLPIRIKEGGYSVDAWLMTMNMQLDPIARPERSEIERCLNPYFLQDKPFSSKEYGFYLVTRLDGYTVDDCKRLINNSVAAKPEKGLFFFDKAENRKGPGFLPLNEALGKAHEVLTARGFQSRVDKTQAFVAPEEPLAGYASWGSNDSAFKAEIYRKLKFKPGALAETFVSTSGRTFNRTTAPGQSLIADLIAQGVTGVKGYVSEPFTFALARPDILFDRYTKGHNLAESFYMASPVIKWKDVVIGDPLSRPYGKAPMQKQPQPN